MSRKLKRRQIKRIQYELERWDIDLVHEFERTFPVKSQYHSQIFFNFWDGDALDAIKLDSERPYQDFWERWNRFKKLKAFL